MAKAAQTQSTQKYLNILAIREGAVIVRDGSLRLIIKVGAINFALKSEEEQNSLVTQYQSFLNSLKFPIQIVMQSRRIDLYSYLLFLKQALEKQTNELVRLQTEDYISYIEKLISKANIMDKRFFVVVPYFPTGLQQTTIIDKVLGAAKSGEVHFTTEQFKKYQQELLERANLVSQGLNSLGLATSILNTQEVVELFYGIYNPEEALNERLVEVNNLQSPVVTSAMQQGQEEVKEANTSENTTGKEQQATELSTTVPIENTQSAIPINTPPTQSPASIPTPASPVAANGQQFYATPQISPVQVNINQEAPVANTEVIGSVVGMPAEAINNTTQATTLPNQDTAQQATGSAPVNNNQASA